jgi:hypothetical protein
MTFVGVFPYMINPCSVWDRVTRVSTGTGAAGVADGVLVPGAAVAEQAATAHARTAVSAAPIARRYPVCFMGRFMVSLLSDARLQICYGKPKRSGLLSGRATG